MYVSLINYRFLFVFVALLLLFKKNERGLWFFVFRSLAKVFFYTENLFSSHFTLCPVMKLPLFESLENSSPAQGLYIVRQPPV